MTFNVDEKRAKILDASGHCLVLGGPGSGKTTLALMKGIRRIEEGLKSGQSVLFLSFSRAAVGRIADALKNTECSAQVRASLAIQTFHSFFWYILRSHGYLLGAPHQLSILASHDEKAMAGGINSSSPDWAAWETERLALFKRDGRLAFDLFAPLTRELLSKATRLRQRISACYPLVIVDEAQDTSSEQWGCMKLLAEHSQIICLADLDQMIYDHLPGVGAQRVAEIRDALAPCEVDLGTDNNRSPGTEILHFARDVLNGQVRGAGYIGVSRHRFHPDAATRDMAIRQSVGIVRTRVRTQLGREPDNIAVLASYGKGVAIISAALRAPNPITHHVLFDEAVVLLSARFAAYLLEPKAASDRREQLAVSLDLLADTQRAKGTMTALASAKKFRKWAARTRAGSAPSVNMIAALNSLLDAIASTPLTGSPAKDWIRIKRDLRATPDALLRVVADHLDYLVAFNRGERISASLAEAWRTHSSYRGARLALDNALAQEQLLSSGEATGGIHVMNMHKAKGKQFDGVVLFRSQYSSPFVWRDDPAPYSRSRKLLHVAISRARVHVLVLEEAFPACDIVGSHVL